MTVVHVLHQAKSCSGSGSDRRRDDRSPDNYFAWIYSPTATRADDRAEVTGVNVSKHGVAFDTRSPVPICSFLKLARRVGDQNVVSEIRIIHCESIEPDHFHVGAEFC